MAQPTNTFSSYDAVGNREDLSDVIYNISPIDTPFQSLARRGTAEAAYTEWQLDNLAAADDTNAVIEGDDATADAINPTVRVGNYCQTSDKVAIVTTVQDNGVNKAGRKREMAYQVAKRGKELKRDMEAILTRNQAAAAGSDVAARKLRSLESWYASNVSMGTGGGNGSAAAARTDGTQRALAESQIKSVMQSAFTNGGQPSVLMVGPFNRVKATEVLGTAPSITRQYQVEDKKLVATVSIYETDFGPLKIVPNRFQRDRSAHLIDPDYVEIAYLESFQSQDLAVTGLTRKKQIWATYTLKMLNEGAHGIIADLLTA